MGKYSSKRKKASIIADMAFGLLGRRSTNVMANITPDRVKTTSPALLKKRVNKNLVRILIFSDYNRYKKEKPWKKNQFHAVGLTR
jgi:hypothetical protein